jgi:hypothetical protein
MTGSIHVGIDYNQAIFAKKNILNCEKDFLGIIKHIKMYDSMKKSEISLKNKVKKDISEVRSMITRIQEDLPKTEEAEITHKTKTEKIVPLQIKEKRVIVKSVKKEDHLEAELREIQEKLDRLNSL